MEDFGGTAKDLAGHGVLLLGLAREGEGIAAGILERLGVSEEKLRVCTLEVLAVVSPGLDVYRRAVRGAAPSSQRPSAAE